MTQKTLNNFRDLKDYYESLPKASKDDFLIKDLVEKGKLMDEDISYEIRTLHKKYPQHPLFNTAIIFSLIWSGHAVEAPQYVSNGIRYLKTGKEIYLEKAVEKSGRFGEEKLLQTLVGWKVILDNFDVTNFDKIKAKDLAVMQHKIWNITLRLSNENKIRGIGNWILFAPFKILIAYRSRLWENKDIDKIKMPLGLEVVRGIKKLIKRNSKYTEGFDSYMLQEEEGGLVEGRAIVELVHDTCCKIAKDYDSRVIHINSGLFLLGRGDL